MGGLLMSRRAFETIQHKQGWSVRRQGNSRATTVYSTQDEAWSETRRRARGEAAEAILRDSSGEIQARNKYLSK